MRGCHASQNKPIHIDDDGLLYLNSSEVIEDIPDGASTTILIGEKLPQPNDRGFLRGDYSALRNTGAPLDSGLYRPDGTATGLEEQMSLKARGFASYHSGTSGFVMADGSARSISNLISIEVLQKLGSRNDGQLLSQTSF